MKNSQLRINEESMTFSKRLKALLKIAEGIALKSLPDECDKALCFVVLKKYLW